MANIFGALNLAGGDSFFRSTEGQTVVYDAAMEYVNRVTADLNQSLSVFVGETTSDHKRRYKLPGSGFLELLADGTKPAPVQAYGSWDVAFPLQEWGAGIDANRVARAYTTPEELNLHVQTVVANNVNTVRKQMLKALLNNTQRTFIDPRVGSLAIEPLANGDSVTYPPVLGATADATENHYLESGYASGSIDGATNNPYKTIKDDLEEHFGATQGGDNIVVFINPAQSAITRAMGASYFTPADDRFITAGQDTARLTGLPAGVPGVTIGRASGTFVQEWRFVPAGYMIGIHLDAPKPLVKRIDPAYTNLGDGLQLVFEDDRAPMTSAWWSHRFGFGAGNRLNGVIMELGTGGSYTIPTGYS